MNGYYLNAEATAETMVGEWVRSGDLGSMDEDGYLYIVGRKKDLIIRGGANIYPVDIEEVLFAHADVAECAVIGVPDKTFGETVKAFVVLKPGARSDAEALTAYCQASLAEYKVPAQIAFTDALPKGPHRQDPAARVAAARGRRLRHSRKIAPGTKTKTKNVQCRCVATTSLGTAEQEMVWDR